MRRALRRGQTQATGTAVLATAVALVGCGPKENVPGTAGTLRTVPAGQGAAKVARLGGPLVLRGTEDTTLEATVVKVVDPLPSGRANQAGSGERFVGVVLKLRNVGMTAYADSPAGGVSLVTTRGRPAGNASADYAGRTCGGRFAQSVNLAPGRMARGCLPFVLARGERGKRFRFGIDAGFGPQSGTWTLR